MMESAASDAVEETAAFDEQTEETDECRICRSSVAELLAADGGCSRGCCCRLFCPGCQRRQPRFSQRPPLHRLRCACTGSVRHVCASCYRRYYLARGLSACEICRQPTGLENEVIDGGDGGLCKRISVATCSNEVPFIVYALFLTFAIVIIFVLFFEANAADSAAEQQSGTSTASPSTPTQQPPSSPQRRMQRIIFVGIASANLGIALAYICFSYWRHRRLADRCCRHRLQPLDSFVADDVDRRAPQPQPVILSVGAVTLAIPQQPPPVPPRLPQSQRLAVSV
ncbi:hypothetical protein BOX15_Mlig021305g2 [Macrostomum lignano]|uniref:Uncharacterized protein n=1 Tax=Macrostomum lignano TaxID=282301 RepID=A0A267FVN6_9PLAT|nr:hypothetical protein BOX15_Mlig021305g2 [Macrostomum lignano]